MKQLMFLYVISAPFWNHCAKKRHWKPLRWVQGGVCPQRGRTTQDFSEIRWSRDQWKSLLHGGLWHEPGSCWADPRWHCQTTHSFWWYVHNNLVFYFQIILETTVLYYKLPCRVIVLVEVMKCSCVSSNVRWVFYFMQNLLLCI